MKNIQAIHAAALASTLMLLAALSVPCHAEGILDQQLGQDGATTQPAEKKAGPPVAPQIIDPGASKTIDDQDLIKKLTNSGDKAVPDAGPEATMKEMVDRMGDSANRLKGKDTGAETQETQRRISMDLDTMIEYARQQSQKSQSSSSKSQQQGEKRQMSSGQQQGAPQNPGGNKAATSSQLPGGGVKAAESNGQDMHQRGPAEWGGLPGRDRDLISNGANEQYLPSYKEMIDRYYEALAEIGKSKNP